MFCTGVEPLEMIGSSLRDKAEVGGRLEFES